MSHWYSLKGEPCHFVKAKDGHSRPTNIADARKLNLVPGVTTVLNVAAKPALERWKMVQAAIAVLTSPRIPGEDLDAFCERVLFADKEQDEEAAKAADLGSRIHAEIESCIKHWGETALVPLWDWYGAALTQVRTYGTVHQSEVILIGNGYGGLCDLILEAPACWWIFDWKTSKKLPTKGAWDEHVIQCAAYAAAFMKQNPHDCRQDRIEFTIGSGLPKPIRTANCYISTTEPGKFVICEHDPDWQRTYNSAFYPLLQFWSWSNSYSPKDL